MPQHFMEPAPVSWAVLTCQAAAKPTFFCGTSAEQQFVDVLIAKKVRALEAGKEAAEPFYR